jgi:single-stranded-DNA-specific exonuclease
MKITERTIPDAWRQELQEAGAHPLLARLFAARGVRHPHELDLSLKSLLPPSGLSGVQTAAERLSQCILQQEPLCIVADYDCDGATACAVAYLGLQALGAVNVSYIVPDRLNDGYGLTPLIAKRVHALGAKVLMTVDNGMASFQGVEVANSLGLEVIITDHHLPAHTTPHAHVIVNPNQKGCSFESKHLAGVGVVFYVLVALRAHLRSLGHFEKTQTQEPKLDFLLPLVALGTVADVVVLDVNNRRLVEQGLIRMRQGLMPLGMKALLSVASKDPSSLCAQDLGFVLGPRINAAGRLADMSQGIDCLITPDPIKAMATAQTLESINQSRKGIEGDMKEQALELAASMLDDTETPPPALCIFDPDFHEGVVGLVASRMKELYHRPTFVFAQSQSPGKEHLLKGSGRSIAGFHLRDALDAMTKKYPDLIVQFGGHAMAAGCTIEEDQLASFELAFQDIAAQLLDAQTLQMELLCDGSLGVQHCTSEVAELLKSVVWGQGFLTPVFVDEFKVVSQKIVAQKHLSLKLLLDRVEVSGIWFGRTEPLAPSARLAYRLECDEWRGQKKVNLLIQAQVSPEAGRLA